MAPKRQREDPNSYLGGDLPATVEFAGQESDETSLRKLTKAERNEARKQANKKWKLVDRKVGSGKDPNPRHTVYYRTQLPELGSDEEWEKFQAALVEPLPVTFRFGSCCPVHVAASLRHSMNTEFRTMRGKFVEIGGMVLKDNVVKPISWPGKDVWQIAADSTTLARNPGLASLSRLLLREVELGHVVRQELASMIPALMLDVAAHHNVLDVCAAPGSKTEQLLSIMRSKHNSSSVACPGMVVANDADPVRINTLRRRYARSGSPNLLVTCSRAEDLQRLVGRPVFDRIVADVPCSGDGTIRKFPHIWRLFRPRMSLELHLVQLQIAIASVQLLKPGGRMVYSTCSINPLEDEAVVAGLLRRFWGRLQLVDTQAEGLLPGKCVGDATRQCML
jgi:16S rRNA C967 or C1407 C5-methylase (RsmB/RsmF family)